MKISKPIYKKLLGNSSSKIKPHNKTNKAYRVDDYNHNTLLQLEDLLGVSNITNYCKEYLTTIGYDWKHWLDIRKKNKSRKRQDYVLPIPKITFGKIWDWRIYLYELGDIEIILPKKKEKPRINSLDFFNAHHIIKLFPQAKGKEQKFIDFLDSIPQHKGTYTAIQNLLSILSDEFWNNLRTIKDPFDLVGYKIPSHPGVLSKMFSYCDDGFGKGEILFCFLIDGARMMGGNESYDIVVENDVVGKLILELKAPKYNSSFRFGKGKLQQFPFNRHILETFKIVNDLFSKFTDEEIKSVLNEVLYISLKDMLYLEKSYRGGEFNAEKIQDLLFFYRYCHEFLDNDKITYSCEITYNISINDRSFTKDIAFNGNYSCTPLELMGLFKTIPYINDPDQLFRDLNKSPQIYIDHNGNVNYFVVFRNGVVKFVKGHELAFDCMTESAVKVIEKDVLTRKTNYDDNLAWEAYKKDKSKTLDEHYIYILES